MTFLKLLWKALLAVDGLAVYRMPIRDGRTNVPIVRQNDVELRQRNRGSGQVRAPTVFWRGEKRRERDVTMSKVERCVCLDQPNRHPHHLA